MAQRIQLDDANNTLHEAYACLPANDLDGAGEALRILVNEASRIERTQHLQASRAFCPARGPRQWLQIKYSVDALGRGHL